MNKVTNITKWKAEHGIEIPDAELRNFIKDIPAIKYLTEVLKDKRQEYYDYSLIGICQEVSDERR